MKSFLVILAAALATSTNAAFCGSTVLTNLITNENLRPCGEAARYDFAQGKKPTEAQAHAFCGVEACESMLETTLKLVTTDCQLPIGDKIWLLADLVLYAKNICDAQTEPPTQPPTDVPTVTPSPPTIPPGPAC